jgi:hypothetical protein
LIRSGEQAKKEAEISTVLALRSISGAAVGAGASAMPAAGQAVVTVSTPASQPLPDGARLGQHWAAQPFRRA